MNFDVGTLVLLGYVPVAVGMFAVWPARRAILGAYLLAVLFLSPLAVVKVPGVPGLGKESAAAVATLLGCLVFAAGPLLRWRPAWMDIPALLVVCWPIVGSVMGGEGVYEGVATAVTLAFRWGVPWVIGRAYFDDVEGMRELALGMVIGGLAYAPLCWLEAELSPQLHLWVYGQHQHAFNQTRRFGGYRPMVFMQHGLAVGLWTTEAALVAVWMWAGRALPRIWGLSGVIVAGGLLGTALACKSLFALVLLAAGVAALWGAWKVGSRGVILALVVAAPAYMGLRLGGDLVLSPVVQAVDGAFGHDRAASLDTRLRNETLIVDRALQRPVTGWGGGGGYLVRDPQDSTKIISVPDQFWVIQLGQNGLVGLAAVTALLLLPAAGFFWMCPPADLRLPTMAPLAAVAVVPVLFMLDCLMNAMMNPMYTIASGAVASLVMAGARVRRAGSERGQWERAVLA